MVDITKASQKFSGILPMYTAHGGPSSTVHVFRPIITAVRKKSRK